MRVFLVILALATLLLGCATGLGCMSTGYRSESFYESGAIKSRRHVYNATVWHEAVKDTFSGVWSGVTDFAGSSLGTAALGAVGLSPIAAWAAVRGKRKSYNKGIEVGAKIKAKP